MMWGSHDGMGWWMLFGGGMWVLFVIAVIFLVLTLVRRFTTRDDAVQPLDAVEIVRSRYARGEISRDEYEQLLQDLRNSD